MSWRHEAEGYASDCIESLQTQARKAKASGHLNLPTLTAMDIAISAANVLTSVGHSGKKIHIITNGHFDADGIGNVSVSLVVLNTADATN
jgi:hypothetical protein